MPTKSITTASLWTLIMVAAKHRRRERVDKTPDGAITGTSPGTLGAFAYKGAMGLNPDDHAEGSGICRGSRFPLMGTWTHVRRGDQRRFPGAATGLR